MSDKFSMTVGQAYELELAFRRNGWTNAQVKQLCGGDVLANIRAMMEKRAKLVFEKHLINTDADPFVPIGWSVEEHQKAGQLEWSPEKIMLFLSSEQEGKKYIEGNKLREELKGKPVLNANVLEYLLKYPELIPGEWKGNGVFFWGTIYRRSDGDLCVRCLYWGGGAWSRASCDLDRGWNRSNPAALSAS